MTSTPVGMRCPDCARQKTKVHTMGSVQTPYVAQVIVAICVLVWIAELATRGTNSSVLEHGALFAPLVADGEWWRIFTAGFLHDNQLPMGFLHIGFNMYFLYYLGTVLEPTLGRVRFIAAFLVSLLGGSLGALLLSPDARTVGASGAVFGLIAVALLDLRSRGIPPFQSELGTLLILNLIITFGFSGYISVGGHLGGLAAGAVVGVLYFELEKSRRTLLSPAVAACIALGVALAVGCIAAASSATVV
jgi:membrane associated rhomboid family serine protease